MITTAWDWLRQLNNAHFAGHSDWRLPVNDGWNSCTPGNCTKELSNLFDDNAPGCHSCLGPCIDPIFGPTETNPAYWSSTTAASSTGFGPDYAWEDFFLCGGDEEGYWDNKDWAYNRVRAVRDAP